VVDTESNLSYDADLEAPLILLCNPWSEDDQVCMRVSGQKTATLLQEYILEEEGMIWVGTATNHRGRAWNFDQFDVDVLRCVLLLLKGLTEKELANPVAIARYMSGKLNSAAEGGVLHGNWSGDYSGGTKPSTWSGSRAILKQYLQAEGQSSVQFGQCWVFSGLFTTVMRCLGIPTRSVTNFESAHDTDDNRQINKYYDKKGEYLDSMTADSVWNFHVWNECFMQRPDLEDGRGGWQAVDATPQELSKIGGKFKCGPSSVEAIRMGEKGDDSKYDNDFLVSEVNADVIFHLRNAEDGFDEVRRDTSRVGQRISTKQPGENKRMDLTASYKHADGSAAERAALYREGEGEGGSTGRHTESAGEKVVEFAMKMSATAQPQGKTPLWWKREHELVGCDLQWELTPTSTDGAVHTVQVHLAAACCAYNGGVRRQIKTETSTVQTGAGTVAISLAMSEYMHMLTDECSLEFVVYAFVEKAADSEKGQTFVADETMYLQPPPLFVALEDKKEKLIVDIQAPLLVTFTNPLPIPLTGVTITVDGADQVIRGEDAAQPGIGAGETVEMKVIITPRREGKLQLIVGFESAELDVGIEGVLHTEVHLPKRASSQI
jgi:transglutaminase 1